MFLITTADQHFWKSEEKVLFLGEWCKPFKLQDYWIKLDHEVVRYHWNDRGKLYNDCLHLERVHEKYLHLLTERLNAVHGEAHSSRYWQIIIGPWLYYFIPILYDRYLSLREASKDYVIKNTWIADIDVWKLTPKDIVTFNRYYLRDYYNHFLYSEIIKLLKLVPYEVISYDIDTPIKNEEREISSIVGSDINSEVLFSRRALKSILKRLLQKLSAIRNPKFVFVSTYFTSKNQWKLEIALRQSPTMFNTNWSFNYAVNPAQRKVLTMNEGKDEFERVLETLIPYQMPVSYVENYKKILDTAYTTLPKKCKVIYTENGYIHMDGFKCWVADQIEKGAKLVIGQQGGLHGIGLWFWIENQLSKIADHVISWGWTDPADSKIQPLPASRLIHKNPACRPKNQGYILWVLMGLPRYFYSLQSLPVASQYSDYIEEQIRLAKTVNPSVRKLLLLRHYKFDFGWGEVGQIRKLNLGIQDSIMEESLEEQLSKSRLFIGTYNGTTFIEAFSADVPTILFWNPYHSELKPSAQPYFEELRMAGIFHDTPESAAQKVNEIFNNPDAWWQTEKVQRAKRNFCEQFAKVSPDWKKEWKVKFSQIIKN